MKLNAILLILAILISGGLVWYSTKTPSDTVPIIRGDQSPIKVKPTERGGMTIANQDSTIYDAMRTENSKRRVENLLAENGQLNKDREELFAGLKTETERQTEIEQKQIISELKDDESVDSRIAGSVPVDIADEQVEQEASPTETAAKSTLSSTPIARPQRTAEKPKKLSNLLAEVQGLKTEPLQKKPKTEKKTSGTFTFEAGPHFIQIGSLKSQSSAEKHWASRRAQFPNILKHFKLDVEKVAIAGKGDFFRVKAGKASKQTAIKACEALNKKYKQSCIVK